MVIHIVNGVRERKAKFFTIYPQNGTILPFRSALKAPENAAPGSDFDPEGDKASGQELKRREGERNYPQPVPSHSLKPILLVDYEAFHAP